MPEQYTIYGKSIKNKDKSRNGDFFKSEILNNDTVILALADGVGSYVCDWLASKTACETFIDLCKKSDKLPTELFSKNIGETNKAILNATPSCKGMMCAFSVVVWNINENIFHYISVGDTRVYLFSGNDLVQISSDDKKAVLMRNRSGKLMSQSGVTIVREGISRAMGERNLTFEIKTQKFNFGETVLLCSDGFYEEKANFKNIIIELIISSDVETATNKLIDRFTHSQKDDMSVLFLRRNDFNKDKIKKFNTLNIEDKQFNNIPQHLHAKFLIEELEKNIQLKDKTNCIKILDYILEKNIQTSKNKLTSLISLMKKNNFTDGFVYRKIVVLIKKTGV